MKDEQRLSRVERKKREQQNREIDGEKPELEQSIERDERPQDAPGEEAYPLREEASVEKDEMGAERKTSSGSSRKRKVPSLSLFNRRKKRRKQAESSEKSEVRNEERAHAVPTKTERAHTQVEQKKRRKWKGKALLLILLLVTVVGYVATSPFTFLVMGSDARVGESLSGSRTDSLQLMEFVPRSRTVQNVSIPRDTYTMIPCEPEQEGDKITHAFAYGGAECTIGAVEGLTDTSVDGQVVITFESFMELIDLIGGVNVTATHSFSEKGFNQTYEYTEGVSYAMDGDMALAYARHRKSDTDGARSSRQTEVMTAVAEKLASPSGWTKIPATYRFMKDEMGLEMNVLQMTSVGLTMIMRPEVNKMQVEGEDAYINNVYYYQPFDESVNEIQDALDLTIWGTVR